MTYRAADIAASYDDHFAEGGMRDSDAYYRWVLNKLQPAPGRTLLDVACGQGVLLRYSSAQGLITHGLDFSQVALATSRKNAPEATLVLANGEQLPYADASLDYVTCLGSLEHYLDPWQGVSEIRRVLKPDGLAAIFVPNSYYLADIFWHVLRKGRGPSHRQVVERFASVREWADMLTMMGLEVVRTYRYNFCWPRSREDWRWYRRYPRKWLYLLTGLLTPFNLSYSFLYICRVAEPRPELNAGLPLTLRRPEGR